MGSVLNKRARVIAARFRLSVAGPNDPDVRMCMRRYLAAWGFPLDARSAADRWVRVTDGANIVAVVGEKMQPDPRDLVITDLYPGPGHRGIIGVYAVLEGAKRLVDLGRLNSVSWMSESANLRHNQALKRILGVEPVAYVWRYGGMPIAGSHSPGSSSEPQEVGSGTLFGLSGKALDRPFQELFGSP